MRTSPCFTGVGCKTPYTSSAVVGANHAGIFSISTSSGVHLHGACIISVGASRHVNQRTHWLYDLSATALLPVPVSKPTGSALRLRLGSIVPPPI